MIIEEVPKGLSVNFHLRMPPISFPRFILSTHPIQRNLNENHCNVKMLHPVLVGVRVVFFLFHFRIVPIQLKQGESIFTAN